MREAGDLRHQRVAHDVGREDAVAVDAAVFSVDDVVLGHDVRDQGAHAHEPAADADQDQRQRRQDRVLEDAEHELEAEAAGHVHLVAAADRQHRPEIAEHDQKDEGHDVVGDRMEAHRDHAERAQDAAVPVVAREPAQKVAEPPGDQGRDQQQAHGPGQGVPDQERNRRREGGERRPEVGLEYAPPEREILVEDTALEAVERAQRLAQHVDRLGARAAERGRGRDRLFDWVDRRHVGHEEGDVDADEDHQDELDQPLADVSQVALHAIPDPRGRRRPIGPAAARLEPEPGAASPSFGPSCAA